jgi:hypothetical protein
MEETEAAAAAAAAAPFVTVATGVPGRMPVKKYMLTHGTDLLPRVREERKWGAARGLSVCLAHPRFRRGRQLRRRRLVNFQSLQPTLTVVGNGHPSFSAISTH